MIHKYLRFAIDLIYPSRCPVCGEFIGYMDGFCIQCHEKINIYDKPYKINNSDFSISVCSYDENISPAVFTLKNKAGNAPYAFALEISRLIEKYKIIQQSELIIPVPMYKSDKLKRGFNQCELIAKELTNITGIPHDFKIVSKIRKTQHQKNLSEEERKINLKNAFAVRNPDKISGKKILIIDDICTTGSTLSEIAGLLKNNGAEKIFCCTFCRTLLNSVTSPQNCSDKVDKIQK